MKKAEKIKNLNDLYQLAEKENVAVECFKLGSVEALSLMQGENTYIAIDPFQLKSAADEKVKLAHDLGHCVQGAFYNQYSPVDIVERSEYKANKWAIEQLIPEDELRKACAEGETTIFELSEHFGVTEQFMRLACDFYANVSEMK